MKSIYCPKRFAFGKSFRTRCQLSILHWNDKDYYLKLDNLIQSKLLSQRCQNVIVNDVIRRKRKKIISDKIETRIKRNIKRKKMASENKVDPKGHQYACDENQLSKKRYDPTRKNFLKPISNIQNIFQIIAS